MNNIHVFMKILLVVAGCLIAATAFAQQWPARAVRIIVPFPPGQAADIIARIIAERLSPVLGQQVVIDNRPGAGAALGTEIGAKSPPDGYTLLAGGSAALAINPHLYPKIGYNTLHDFAPVTQIVDIAEVFVVNPSVPAHNLTDYVRLAKKHPGELNYGSSGAGSTSHLVTAALAARGEPAFRAGQIMEWLYKKRVTSWDAMTNLSKSLRAKLHEVAEIRGPGVVYEGTSSDGTRKWVLEVEDGSYVETVLIPAENGKRRTLCVSSQVGCSLDCSFCSTGSSRWPLSNRQKPPRLMSRMSASSQRPCGWPAPSRSRRAIGRLACT